jgi:F420-dependent oxidoreductase-like protein
MRLGLNLGYSGAGMQLPVQLVQHAEKLGFDSVWSAEAYGSDAVSPLGYLAALTTKIKLGTAIMQMPARTPAMTAMTAMTLDQLSGGRFILGLGPSGPQVVEGWHGVPYGKPLERTREYIDVIRQILAREKPLEHHGEHYQIPNTGPGSSGLGKPLKSILHGRKDMKIFTASIGAAGIRTSGEVADGVIPVWMSPERIDLILPYVKEGIAKAGGNKHVRDFAIAPFVTCVLGDDLERCRMPVKGMLALYIGGMGARNKNFYNDYAKRLGYEAEAKRIQDLYLDGKKAEAMAAVPDALVDQIALVGPAGRIRERVAAWKGSGVTDMILGAGQPEALDLVAKAAA